MECQNSCFTFQITSFFSTTRSCALNVDAKNGGLALSFHTSIEFLCEKSKSCNQLTYIFILTNPQISWGEALSSLGSHLCFQTHNMLWVFLTILVRFSFWYIFLFFFVFCLINCKTKINKGNYNAHILYIYLFHYYWFLCDQRKQMFNSTLNLEFYSFLFLFLNLLLLANT